MISLNLCDWHPVFLHFPIVLIWTALVFDLLGWIRKANVYPAGHWIMIAGGLMTIPTAATGLACFDEFSGHPYLFTHLSFAVLTVVYSLFHAAWRWRVLQTKKAVKAGFFVLLSSINVLLVSITADYGGRIAFGKKPSCIEQQPAKEHHQKHHKNDSTSP